MKDIFSIIEKAKLSDPYSSQALKYEGISFLVDCDLEKEQEYKEYYKEILLGKSQQIEKTEQDKALNLKK